MPAEVVRSRAAKQQPEWAWEWVCEECEVESVRYWHPDDRYLAQREANEHNLKAHKLASVTHLDCGHPMSELVPGENGKMVCGTCRGKRASRLHTRLKTEGG
jgi:formylmethanofuran dehydrogenase subunit E